MILRIDGENLILTNIGQNNDEDQFLELNPGFIKVSELPYSVSGYYKYDENQNIIVNDIYELESLKNLRMEEVATKFDELMFNGVFESSLGFTADNRRGDGKDDKDNVQSLIDLGHEPIYFRDADSNFHALTTEDLILLKQEMIQDGLLKYQWKWDKEAEIMNATKISDLLNINI